MKKRSFAVSTSQIIMLSFILVIFLGSILLVLPISAANGHSVGYVNALFTSTTATCVTGLVTLPTVSTWSLFGQVVILILIQVGGLGVVTIMSAFLIALSRKMTIGDRILIQDAFNLNTLSGLVKFVKKVVSGTIIVESIGAIFYMTVFIPKYGHKGIWISVFNAVSAFCNAGIDIISKDSLCEYATNPVINAVTSALIIIGGIGYIVWWDLVGALRKFKNLKFKCFRTLSLHSKIAISSTIFYITIGAAVIFIFEYNNPLTIKDCSLFDKIQISLFQSVTTRTAGFATIPQQNLTNGSAFTCLLLMFIGGSPVGTAGGIKTVTFTVLIASAVSTIRNKSSATIFNRTLSKNAVNKAAAITVISFATVFVSTLLLSAVTKAPALDIIYETISATATVGLSRDLTSYLDTAGKLIIIGTMYLGRIGPISMAIALNTKKTIHNTIENPIEEINVG